MDLSLSVKIGAALLAAFVGSPAVANGAIGGVWKISTPSSALPVEGKSVPFTAEGQKLYQQHKSDRARGVFEFDLTQARCSSPGPTRLMLSPKRLRILTRPDSVAIQFEWNNLLRQIDLRGKPIKPALVSTMIGSSRGRWEGATLVVDTVNVSDRTLLDDLLPHSEDMQITEHFRLKDPDTLEDRITIQDAAFYTHSWDALVTYKRVADTPFEEDICLDRLTAGQSPLPR